MLTRRQLVLNTTALAAVAPALVACTSADSVQEAAQALRYAGSTNGLEGTMRLHALVRYATLAPSSHNTQCWQFQLGAQSITIRPDLSRRCPAVDPDDHHLFVSLGCAAENLAQAAPTHGLQAYVRFDPAAIATAATAAGTDSISVQLDPARPVASPLFQAITERQCTRGDFDGQPLSTRELQLLEQAGTGRGVHIQLLTARPAIETVLDYVVAANTAQMGDAAFVDELTAWIRFSADEAVRKGDGLFAGATGSPSMPRWLGSKMMGLFFTPKSENERYARQIRNAAGIAIFVSEANDKQHWIEAGRCYERFALQATALGIRNAFLNQPVEVGSLRPQFASWLGLRPDGSRPDLVVRFGRGPAMPWSMRRPLQAVLA